MDISPSPSSPPFPPAVTAAFTADDSGAPQLRLSQPEITGHMLCFGLHISQLFNLGPLEALLVVEKPGINEGKEKSSFSKAFKHGFRTQDEREALKQRLNNGSIEYHIHKMEEDLYEIDIPINFIASLSTRVHGLAFWFDVLFNGSMKLFDDLIHKDCYWELFDCLSPMAGVPLIVTWSSWEKP